MSKEAALRAMREARYAERTKATAAPKPVRPSLPRAETAAPVAPAEVDEGVCGHRSMNGRSCTREQGHAAKSHRYS